MKIPFFLLKRYNPVHKGEEWQTLCFVSAGYLLCGILTIWCMTDIHYQSETGTSYPVTTESIVFGTILTILCGFLVPGACFWFKFYRWWLAWIMLFTLSLTIGIADWYFEKRPEAIIHRTFGKYANNLLVEAFVVNEGYESDYKVFLMTGDIANLQNALQNSFPDGRNTEYVIMDRLPKFMRNSSPVVFNWSYSNFLRSWKTADGKYYLFIETWHNFHAQEWNRMIHEEKP